MKQELFSQNKRDDKIDTKYTKFTEIMSF